MPGTKFVAVIAGLRVTGGGAKIIEVRRGTGSVELMVARGRARAGFCAAPSLVVALEVFLAAIRMGKVAGDHDSPGDLVEQFGSGFRTGEILAVRDVTRPDKNRTLIAGRRTA